MAREVLGIAGAAIGGFLGGPVGAQIGFTIGSVVGGIIDPPHIDGPKLGDAGLQTSRDGVPIPIAWGLSHVVGNIIQINPIVETTKKVRSGKGGTTTTETRRTRTFAIGIARGPEGPISGLIRVWENNKLVYDARDVPTLPAEDSAAFLASVNLYLGTDDQLPDPELEAESGVGTTPAYRGLAYLVFVNKDITDFGSSIPSYRFEIETGTTVYDPLMMNYGSGNWFDPGNGWVGTNALMVIARISRDSFTGGNTEYLFNISLQRVTRISMIDVHIVSSDHAITEIRGKVICQVLDNTGTLVCKFLSKTVIADGNEHMIFFSYDGDAGDATFYIDSLDADDTGYTARIAPITGTLDNAPIDFWVGALGPTNTSRFGGRMGFCGIDRKYLTNPLDFMDGNHPKELDVVTWTEFGTEPDNFDTEGEMLPLTSDAGSMILIGTLPGPD